MNLLRFKLIKPQFWYTKNLLSLFLYPFSLIYYLFFLLKKNLVSSYEYNVPIICVGNIYIGGTGKTPLTIFLYHVFKKKFRPAIIKKYYNNQIDEINFLKSKSKKVFVKDTRDNAINDSIKEKCNLLILDDGFQDFSIKKSLNIVCFNSRQLLGNEMMLPAGPLREPIVSLKKCDIVIINGEKNKEFEEKVHKINNLIKIFYSKYKILNKNKFKKGKYLAFSGIGNPSNFFYLLKKNGIKLSKTLPFPDHYNFSDNEIKNFFDTAKKNKLKIITTEKDYYRIKKKWRSKIQFLAVSLVIDKQKFFLEEIKRFIK